MMMSWAMDDLDGTYTQHFAKIPFAKVMCPSWDVFNNLAHDWYHLSRPFTPPR
jgi:hypothetical protein